MVSRGVDVLGESQGVVVIVLSCLLFVWALPCPDFRASSKLHSAEQSRAEAEPYRPPAADRTRVASCKRYVPTAWTEPRPAGIFLTAVSQRHFHSRRVDLSLLALPWAISRDSG